MLGGLCLPGAGAGHGPSRLDMAKGPSFEGPFIASAVTYSPTQSPGQYHRRRRA